MQFHESDGKEPVEPRVSNLLHGLSESVKMDLPQQRLALRTDILGESFTANNHNVALFLHGNRIAIGNSELGGTRRHGGDEILPRLGGIFLQGVAIDRH